MDNTWENGVGSNAKWLYRRNELDFFSKVDFGEREGLENILGQGNEMFEEIESSTFVELWWRSNHWSKNYMLLVSGHEE